MRCSNPENLVKKPLQLLVGIIKPHKNITIPRSSNHLIVSPRLLTVLPPFLSNKFTKETFICPFILSERRNLCLHLVREPYFPVPEFEEQWAAERTGEAEEDVCV